MRVSRFTIKMVINLPFDEITLRILTGKKHPKLNCSAYKKHEYGHLGRWTRGSKTETNFPKK